MASVCILLVVPFPARYSTVMRRQPRVIADSLIFDALAKGIGLNLTPRLECRLSKIAAI
jgi:hypothetical protein